jgi:hypothetical protein
MITEFAARGKGLILPGVTEESRAWEPAEQGRIHRSFPEVLLRLAEAGAIAFFGVR